ncbi:MarR family winged helix-turn-helix transcriptional regulator [Aliikangiella coralliicola]|uniref:Winged helix-turn-helix transcriptional regulator n=1 Tax=Aliikangiella coralliicola TaxID=2592383 RepID=A0A545UGZ0_9GAMM|nr:MarR family winged helix-turn-helix transcriptional regulator [Aliikangiella coralliicola]TQV88735.1 winged helix-turn-helix transcriptional regulator [Aliikangiella coralliicola]
MNKKPSDEVVMAWVYLLKAQNAAMGHVEAMFKKGGLPPFSWYDVLWELEKEDAVGLRQFQLEERLLVSQYGLSRLLTRIEKAEYVERLPCSEDGRGHRVVITRPGKKIRAKMWEVYSQAINTAVGDRLSDKQCEQLKRLLANLVD